MDSAIQNERGENFTQRFNRMGPNEQAISAHGSQHIAPFEATGLPPQNPSRSHLPTREKYPSVPVINCRVLRGSQCSR
jgi:hypothetical protein